MWEVERSIHEPVYGDPLSLQDSLTSSKHRFSAQVATILQKVFQDLRLASTES